MLDKSGLPANYKARLQSVLDFWKTDLEAAPDHRKVVTCTQLKEDAEVLSQVGDYIDSLHTRIAVLEASLSDPTSPLTGSPGEFLEAVVTPDGFAGIFGKVK